LAEYNSVFCFEAVEILHTINGRTLLHEGKCQVKNPKVLENKQFRTEYFISPESIVWTFLKVFRPEEYSGYLGEKSLDS
jgi:hypothetical protein